VGGVARPGWAVLAAHRCRYGLVSESGGLTRSWPTSSGHFRAAVPWSAIRLAAPQLAVDVRRGVVHGLSDDLAVPVLMDQD